MIEKIKKIAEERYTREEYYYHILPVVKNAVLLAKKLNADLTVVEIAAYLHDIGRTEYRKGVIKENIHHIIGEKETRKILKELECKEDFIEKVAHCVLAHRGRAEPEPETKEAKIVACADAMAHFDTFLDLFKFFLDTTDSFEKTVEEIDAKIDRNWNKKLTIPEAKEIIKDKYKAIKLIINSMKEYIK